MKTGDRLCCKVENLALDLKKDCWYDLFYIGFGYGIGGEKLDTVYCFDYINTEYEIYYSVKVYESDIYKYFYSTKEVRKLKLNEIENEIGM